LRWRAQLRWLQRDQRRWLRRPRRSEARHWASPPGAHLLEGARVVADWHDPPGQRQPPPLRCSWRLIGSARGRGPGHRSELATQPSGAVGPLGPRIDPAPVSHAAADICSSHAHAEADWIAGSRIRPRLSRRAYPQKPAVISSPDRQRAWPGGWAPGRLRWRLQAGGWSTPRRRRRPPWPACCIALPWDPSLLTAAETPPPSRWVRQAPWRLRECWRGPGPARGPGAIEPQPSAAEVETFLSAVLCNQQRG